MSFETWCSGALKLLLVLSLLPAALRAATFRAVTAEAAATAARHAQAGDEIVLADGEFNNLELTLTAKGTPSRPLRLRASNPGKTRLTGSPRLAIAGAFIEVQGLVFGDCVLQSGTQGAVVFDGSANSLLSGCRFENAKLPHGAALVSFRNGAHDNRVATNRFLNTRYKAVMVVVDDKALKAGPPVRNRIDHNLFQDVPPLKGNGAETIQIGQRAAPHSDLQTATLVEENEFVRCNGEAEIVSVKTSGNLIRSNLFRHCTGELVMRHGHGNVLTGNRFEAGLGGIRLSGQGHVVAGNFIQDCRATGIRLYYGTPDLKHPASYLPVFDCVITTNTILNCRTGILVGDHKNARLVNKKWAGPPWFASSVQECTIAPYNNRIVGNIITGKAGSLLRVNEAPNNSLETNTLKEQPASD
jgi:poly(beta-D-mannuronate) lyase